MKTLLWVSCLFMAVTVTSCTKKNYYTTPSQTIVTAVKSTDWTVDQAGTSLAVNLSMPEITSNVAQNYDVSVGISYDDPTAADFSFETIPEVYGGYSFSYLYGVTQGNGFLTLYVQTPSGGVPATNPANIEVKIVLTPSVQ